MKDKRWKNYYSNYVLPLIIRVGEETIALDDKFERFQCNQKNKLIPRYFHAWKNTTIRFTRREIVEKVDRMDESYYKSKKRNILHVLSAVSLGASSRKKILQRRRNGLANARSSLVDTLASKNQRKGIITNEMVQVELRRIFHTELFQWNRKKYLASNFIVWRDIMQETRRSKLRAYSHFRSKFFVAWKCWTLKNITLISGDCTNSRDKHILVDSFRRKRLVGHAFRGWRIKARMYEYGKQMRRKILSHFVSEYLHEWHRITKHHRHTKRNILKRWKGYQKYTVYRSFSCWQIVIISLKQFRQDQDRFLSSYNRVKEKRQQWNIFRIWRQQARYGRVTSLYSRQDLLQKLAIQSRKIDCLETQIESYVK